MGKGYEETVQGGKFNGSQASEKMLNLTCGEMDKLTLRNYFLSTVWTKVRI